MHHPTVFAIVILFVGSAGAQVRHWTETPKETIWRSPYTNCDMGYAVDLPKGVVAHASLPPSPNHGFLISASVPGTTAEVTLEDQQRILDVYDQYDATELGSARVFKLGVAADTEQEVFTDLGDYVSGTSRHKGTLSSGCNGLLRTGHLSEGFDLRS
jgi:hypothetical protein